MTYLGIRTDTPVAELYLYDDENRVDVFTWQADRQLARELLEKLTEFLEKNGTDFSKLGGLFVFKGPGSFTGLRIGITVMNTIAYAQSVPIVGSNGEDWIEDAIDTLMNGENDRIILPFYGADPRITSPKK